MANSKQLTASVRLNSSQFESKLKRIAKAIDALNNAVNKQSNAYDAVNRALGTTVKQTNKINQATNKAAQSTSRLKSNVRSVLPDLSNANNRFNAIKTKVTSITAGLRSWTANIKGALAKLNPMRTAFGSIWGLVKQIAGVLFGIGTVKLAITGADTLTGAQNRFNYVSANQLGEAGYQTDPAGNKSYSQKTLDMTQDTMDKIYGSAQKVRTSYSDMLSNVSKTLTLAPEAFGGSIDNAIRFQEIMAEAYAVGGASAQEMSTSMYQLTQALGAGVLAGDELRSVREGAPLAYQAIEEFAQGVLHSEESLKDLASQGRITSDIVVAAIMDAGGKLDDAFALTKYRFIDVWTQINSATEKAFEPVVEMMTDKLNESVDNGLVQRVEQFITNVAKAVIIVFELIVKAGNWVAENWESLKKVLVGVISLLSAYYLVLGTISIVSAVLWAIQHWALLLTIVLIAAVIYKLYEWRQGVISTGELIIACLAVIAIAIMMIGVVTHSMTTFIIGLVLLVITWIASKSANLCDFLANLAEIVALAIVGIMIFILGVYLATGTIMMSIPMLIGLLIVGILALLLGAFLRWTGQIVGFAYGLKEAIGAIFENIKIAFQNILASMGYLFWKWIDSIIDDFKPLLAVVNKVLEAMGKKTIDIDFAANKAKALSEEIGFVSVGDAYKNGYSEGYAIGEGIKDKINGFGDKIKGLGSKFQKQESYVDDFDTLSAQQRDNAKLNAGQPSLLDQLGKKLGLDFGDMGKFPKGGVDGSSAEDLLGDISADTGKISDSMELTEEDLEYLRRVADMEWKKEYTTASVVLDVTNHNNVNSDLDVFGIANKISEVLYEEMDYVANGVYAY